MKRSLTAGGVLLAFGLALGACSETSQNSVSGGAGGVARYVGCGQYTSCASCTPIVGCGWCYLADGTGKCADDPNDCAASSAFSWTWDPKGCHVAAEAGVNAVDAGPPASDATTEGSDLEAAAREAAVEASDARSAAADATDAEVTSDDGGAADGTGADATPLGPDCVSSPDASCSP